MNRLSAASEIVATTRADLVVPADPDDDFIVQAANYGKADVLCTRDSHLQSPGVVEHCQRHAVQVLDDVQGGRRALRGRVYGASGRKIKLYEWTPWRQITLKRLPVHRPMQSGR